MLSFLSHRSLWILLVCWLAVGCRCSGGKQDGEPLRVEYAGCAREYVGPVCEIEAKANLVVWVQAPPHARIDISSDLPVQVGVPAIVQGGKRFRVSLEKQPRELRVVVREESRERSFRLSLRPLSDPAEMAQARTLFGQGKIAELEELLLGRLGGMPPAHQAVALDWLARAALGRGAIDLAVQRFGQALDKNRAVGSLSGWIRDINALSHTLIYQGGRFSEVRALFKDLPGPQPLSAFLQIYRDYAQGTLAYETGDLRAALSLFLAAVQGAERLERDELRQTMEQMLALTLQLLGRQAEAAKILDRLWAERSPGAAACDQIPLLTNRAWARLLALEAGQSAVESPIAELKEALALVESGCPRQTQQKRNLLLNLALFHWHQGELQAIHTMLDEIARLDTAPLLRDRMSELDLRARLALKERRHQEALRHYEKLARAARAAWLPELEWQALVGRGDVLAAAGRATEALSAFEQAETLLDRQLLDVPLGEGRATFAALRQGATRRHVKLLIGLGRGPGALEVVRRAQTRAFGTAQQLNRFGALTEAEQRHRDQALRLVHEERARLAANLAGAWQWSREQTEQIAQERQVIEQKLRGLQDAALSVHARKVQDLLASSRLAPPAAGEVLLSYFDLGPGWIGFAADQREVLAKPLDPLPPSPTPRDLSRILLEPFGALIQRNSQVKVLPCDELESVDFHGLPWAGGVLLEHKDVVYGLDLVRSPSVSSPPGRASPSPPRSALIVLDPESNLGSGQWEEQHLAPLIRAARPGWDVTALVGPRATREAISDRLARSDLLHFSGHGRFGGLEGWKSALGLAEGESLLVGDILSLPAVPSRVVLLGCETGKSNQRQGAGIGLAQAFLLGGSQEVIAAWRPVEDRLARLLAEELYARPRADNPDVLPLRQAQLSLRKKAPGADWAVFRRIVP